MNLKTYNAQAPQSSLVNAMRPLTEQQLGAIVGGLKITVTNKKGEKIVIDM